MDLLTQHAEAQPHAPAIIDDAFGNAARTISFAEYEDRACRLANALAALGVSPGDKITTVGYNHPDQLVISSAGRKLRAVSVAMNYRLKPAEMAYQLDDADTVVVFAGPEHTEAVESVRGECPTLRHAITFGADDVPAGWQTLEAVIANASAEPPESGDQMMGATMNYTAGTTGNPKGAYRANGMPAEVVRQWAGLFDLRPGDVHLVAGPMHHSAPGAMANLCTALGGCDVIMRRFDAERALRHIAEHRVTSTFMAPILLQRITDLPREVQQRYDLSSMRSIIMAAAPCPTEVKRRVHELFGEVLYEFYGASETGVNTVLRPEEQLRKPGSCGRIAPDNEVRILDDDGRDCPRGTPGEIYVRNDVIIDEYYKKPEKTRESWKDGFFSVGDVGYLDDDGFLFVVDRKRDMVISGGVNIYCAEIEDALHFHPRIQDLVVFGVPDDEWGERVHAAVQPHEGEAVTLEEVADFVGEHLADYKKPRSLEVHDALPRDEAGKLRKRDLREPHWDGREKKI